MFNKILIANRGEIVCRVIRTAKRMGIDTVAVYSDADARSLHVRLADEAIRIGPAPAAESYLNVDAIISACKQTGAQAVHPGYGFLSEDTDFGKRLADEGIDFIGPGPAAIEAMGDKITSKKIARDAGVSVIPGFDDVIENPDHAVELANKIGYPVMLKPTSAGGGKGMRLAYDDETCREGFVRSTSEAMTHFGDDRVFVEKFIESPRHIEIQVLADSHGNIIHLGERECSLQRRHQKVIEEAPSPFLVPEIRVEIANQAITLVRAVGYISAGTVEFVVDTEQNFYFLEMNTRLQVEHPVTEFVTGIDLVEWMIRIAANDKLTITQNDVTTTGWAVESRIYAEDPARNFLPSTGRLIRCQPPAETDQIRVDTGVYEGGEVSIHYDPMIAKLITYGKSRDQAFASMAAALDEYRISGVTSNIPFLQTLVRHPAILQGDMNTGFIEQSYPEGYDCESVTGSEHTELAAMIAVIVHYLTDLQSASLGGQLNERNWTPATHWVVVDSDSAYDLMIETIDDGHKLTWHDERYFLIRHTWKPGQYLFRGSMNYEKFCVQISRTGLAYRIEAFGQRFVLNVFTPQAAEYNHYMLEKKLSGVSPFLKSPMPGLLVQIYVKEGQEVKNGEAVAVVEAMKMENILRSKRDGIILRILAGTGDSLAADQPILEFEQASE